MTARTKFENVEKLATCKRCGDTLVAWREGKKWYLVRAHVATNFTPRVACAPREFHVCIPEQTPAEIDSKLADLWILEQSHERYLDSLKARLAQKDAGGRVYETRDELVRRIEEHEERIAYVRKLAQPFEAEFDRRGGWLRYFLVKNAGGHVHRERECSTCRPTTQYAWLYEISGCDEDRMIEEYGITACTACFPNAPAHPAWIEAAKKAEDAANDVCAGSGTRHYDAATARIGYYSGNFGVCDDCGERVTLTSANNLRKHKRPAVTAAAS